MDTSAKWQRGRQPQIGCNRLSTRHVDGMTDPKTPQPDPQILQPREVEAVPTRPPAGTVLPKEIGGAAGPEPTRYGDWQHKGRVTDF